MLVAEILGRKQRTKTDQEYETDNMSLLCLPLEAATGR